MLQHIVIHEASEVHTELLPLTTSCQIYNLLKESLRRESSKVLKRTAEGKLASREQGGENKQRGEGGKRR